MVCFLVLSTTAVLHCMGTWGHEMRWHGRRRARCVRSGKKSYLYLIRRGDIRSIVGATCLSRGLPPLYTPVSSPPLTLRNGPRGDGDGDVECQYQDVQRCRWGIVAALIAVIAHAHHKHHQHSGGVPPRTRLSCVRCAVLRTDATCETRRATLPR